MISSHCFCQSTLSKLLLVLPASNKCSDQVNVQVISRFEAPKDILSACNNWSPNHPDPWFFICTETGLTRLTCWQQPTSLLDNMKTESSCLENRNTRFSQKVAIAIETQTSELGKAEMLQSVFNLSHNTESCMLICYQWQEYSVQAEGRIRSMVLVS